MRDQLLPRFLEARAGNDIDSSSHLPVDIEHVSVAEVEGGL